MNDDQAPRRALELHPSDGVAAIAGDGNGARSHAGRILAEKRGLPTPRRSFRSAGPSQTSSSARKARLRAPWEGERWSEGQSCGAGLLRPIVLSEMVLRPRPR